uniref:Uncharacterized protein n=1 Tax=Strongyloides papillosus TaxID=174720 RepID=A0A0N5B703_STREA
MEPIDPESMENLVLECLEVLPPLGFIEFMESIDLESMENLVLECLEVLPLLGFIEFMDSIDLESMENLVLECLEVLPLLNLIEFLDFNDDKEFLRSEFMEFTELEPMELLPESEPDFTNSINENKKIYFLI